MYVSFKIDSLKNYCYLNGEGLSMTVCTRDTWEWKDRAQVALKQEYVGVGSNLYSKKLRQFSYSGTEKKELILL